MYARTKVWRVRGVRQVEMTRDGRRQSKVCALASEQQTTHPLVSETLTVAILPSQEVRVELVMQMQSQKSDTRRDDRGQCC